MPCPQALGRPGTDASAPVNASVSAVSELVSKDLAIASKLIQRPIPLITAPIKMSDPSAAVLPPGLETTSALVLSIEAFARSDKLKPLYFSIDRVWKHSQIVADLARKISKRMGSDLDTSGQPPLPQASSTMSANWPWPKNFEEQYQTTVQRAEKENAPVHTIEKEVFGATHAATGAYLLAVWGLPLPIVRAVAHHHLAPDLLDASFPEVVALHFLAEQIVAGRKPLEELARRISSGMRCSGNRRGPRPTSQPGRQYMPGSNGQGIFGESATRSKKRSIEPARGETARADHGYPARPRHLGLCRYCCGFSLSICAIAYGGANQPNAPLLPPSLQSSP